MMDFRRTLTVIPVAIGLGAIPAISGAASASPAAPTPVSVGADVGTLGLGVRASALVSPKLAIRVGYDGYNYSKNGTSGSLSYNGTLKLSNVGVVADLYPAKGVFHWSAGFIVCNNKLDSSGKPSGSGGTYTINGVAYPASSVGTLNGHVNYGSFAPYIGFGWGKPSSKGRIQIVSEIGAMFQGGATASLTASNPVAYTIQGFKSDLAAQQQKIKDDANKLQIYPVLSAGIVWNFD